MTVEEMIGLLKDLPQAARVYVRGPGGLCDVSVSPQRAHARVVLETETQTKENVRLHAHDPVAR